MTSIHAGPIAASAADMALVYQILAEPPPPDHYYYRLYGPGTGPPRPHLHGFGLTQDLKGLTLGLFPEHFEDAEPAVVAACRAAVVAMVARGAKTLEVALPHMHALSISHGMAIQVNPKPNCTVAHVNPNPTAGRVRTDARWVLLEPEGFQSSGAVYEDELGPCDGV